MQFNRVKITLVYTSDVHLGSERPDEARRGFEEVLSAVRRLRALALLIAGDLFDRSRTPPEVVSYDLQSLEALETPRGFAPQQP